MPLEIELIRAEDLLNLHVEAMNLERVFSGESDESDTAREFELAVVDTAQPGLLIFTFPPQTIAERAYFEAAQVTPEQGVLRKDPDPWSSVPMSFDPPGSVGGKRATVAQLGHPSRLVFRVPPGVRVPFTTAGLLDWSQLELQVNPLAAIGPQPSAAEIAAAPAIREPGAHETALELPYRLVISPGPQVAWEHREEPFTRLGRTELWHTRLRLESGATAPFRAIWSPDYDPDARGLVTRLDPDLQRTAMAPDDRYQLVILTSEFHGYQSEVEFDSRFIAAGGNPRIEVGANIRERGVNVAGPALAPVRWKTKVPFVPQPFYVEQLMLSPLGGWLRSRGHWQPPQHAPPQKLLGQRFNLGDLVAQLPRRLREVMRLQPLPVALERDFAVAVNPHLFEPIFERDRSNEQLDLSEWVHDAAQGRDHYVRIVYEGELWPFRHRAALIKVTERKFEEQGGIVGAYLVQRMFIVVREPEVSFAKEERGIPFQKVRLTTLVTPDIAESQRIPKTQRSFWVEVLTPGPVLFQFHAVGTDLAGEQVDFTIPLMFVSISDVRSNLANVALGYNSKEYIDRRSARVPGQKLTFAERTVANGNTQLVTDSLSFVVNAAGTPPRMLKAAVRIPQVEQLVGTDAATTIRFYEDYVARGIGAVNGVFAEIAKDDLSLFNAANPLASMVATTLGVEFSADKAGGFATPNMGVSTLSRELGPLAGRAADAVADAFDPANFFKGVSARLFGSLDLAMLLTNGSASQNAPKLRTRTEDIAGVKSLVAELTWEPAVQRLEVGPVAFEKDRGERATKLVVNGRIKKPLRAGAPGADAATFDFKGTLNDFRVSLLGQVTLNFDSFEFTTKSGAKPDVTVKLDPATPVEFAGDLTFVEELRKAIPPGLFGDGPSLDISPAGIRAGFAIALPPIAVGVFALKDVSLGAALTLPFLDGKPVFDFNVSERAHPFLLAVSFLGGGGFFHLQLDTAGIKELEAAFEFGATAAIDLGVASGEVHIFAGIYFSLQRDDTTSKLLCTLSGYLRLGGSLSVLGLVHVSVEFNLSFTYDSKNDKAYGRATLTVQVSVLGLSKSVELTVERGFGGSSGDPTFGQLFDTPATWSDYAGAFA